MYSIVSKRFKSYFIYLGCLYLGVVMWNLRIIVYAKTKVSVDLHISMIEKRETILRPWKPQGPRTPMTHRTPGPQWAPGTSGPLGKSPSQFELQNINTPRNFKTEASVKVLFPKSCNWTIKYQSGKLHAPFWGFFIHPVVNSNC